MTRAICFKCGNVKTGAFTPCKECGVAPHAETELSVSLVLCEHLSSMAQLAKYRGELRKGRRPAIAKELLTKAQEALKDPQLMELLGDAARKHDGKATPKPETQRPTGKPSGAPPSSTKKRKRPPRETALTRNAFWLLGATTRDDRRRIVELADERALDLDHDTCQKARADLTNPRTRLVIEMGWLPGVSPKKAVQLVRRFIEDPLSVRSESGLPALARANLMSAAFEMIDEQDSAAEVAEFIGESAQVVDKLSIDDVLRDINEDRAVSGFPEIKARDQVENELSEKKRHYRGVIKEALDRLSPATLIEAMTKVVERGTSSGRQHAPELIDSLVDSYEVEVQEFLQKESENIQKLIAAARDSAKSGEHAVKPLVDSLESVTRNWDRVAQPIQLSAKARGIEHQASNEVAFAIRNLAIELFNEHGLLPQAQRITGLLQELFSELPELAERVEQDVDALEEIFLGRKNAEAHRKEWEREITYQAEIGVLFKDTLSISPQGVLWKGHHFPLESITRVRWGGVRQSVNGIPTGTTYTIGVGSEHSEAVIGIRRQEVYTTFLDKLWRAVCFRILAQLLEALKDGHELSFGDALIRDDGVTLTKHKFLGSELIRFGWHQIQVWTANGTFNIGAKEDKKACASLSYIDVPNVHLLEQAIRMAFKKAGMRRLSDVLNDN